MRNLARSALHREIELDTEEGKFYEVPAPSVRDAVEFLVSCKGAIAGEPSNLRVFWSTVRRWLPLVVSGPLSVLPPVAVVRMLLPILLEGTPRDPARDLDEEELPEIEDPIERLVDLDLRGMLAEYCGEFGADPWNVYNRTPWPFFVGEINKLKRLRARRKVETLDVYRIRYIEDDFDRKDAIRALYEDAGIHVKELTREEKIERSKRNLEALARVWGKGNA